jgi:hypothetical protein
MSVTLIMAPMVHTADLFIFGVPPNQIFNALPKVLNDIANKTNKFKTALKHFLHLHSFYSLDEFYNKQRYLPCCDCMRTVNCLPNVPKRL